MESANTEVKDFGYGEGGNRGISSDAEKMAQAVRDGIITVEQLRTDDIPHEYLYGANRKIKVDEGHSGFSFYCVRSEALRILDAGGKIVNPAVIVLDEDGGHEVITDVNETPKLSDYL